MSMIFLIGMPGVGKTYWAGLLAKHHAYRMIDLDEYITQQEEKTVTEIFAAEGETVFREYETRYLRQIISDHANEKVIVACGGGTPAFNDNIRLMKENGCVVYLQADYSTLQDRLKHDDTRPLLSAGVTVEEILIKLYNQRQPYYHQAHYTLDANNITITDFDKIIALCIKQQ